MRPDHSSAMLERKKTCLSSERGASFTELLVALLLANIVVASALSHVAIVPGQTTPQRYAQSLEFLVTVIHTAALLSGDEYLLEKPAASSSPFVVQPDREAPATFTLPVPANLEVVSIASGVLGASKTQVRFLESGRVSPASIVVTDRKKGTFCRLTIALWGATAVACASAKGAQAQ